MGEQIYDLKFVFSIAATNALIRKKRKKNT